MHFNLKRAMGVMAIPVLGSALAVGATALPAHATTWQDTALSAGAVTPSSFGGSNLFVANGSVNTDGVINLTGTGVTSWSLHGTRPTGVILTSTVSGATISYTGAGVTPAPDIVVDATDSAGNADALVIPVTITADSILGTGLPGSVTTDTVSWGSPGDTNTAGTVTFSASSTPGGITYAETSLPTGLVSGSPLTYAGGTAAPTTYGGVKVTATDADGAALTGTFALTVYASHVHTASGYGAEVNPFGNGFDVYQQHRHAGAIIAGWTATQADPATHFLVLSATHSGAVRFEYAPNGVGTGLCVSDPGGGWAADPLRDGLILAWCNNGAWQQFVPQSNGTLKDVATGLVVNPDGAGAQLRGSTAVTSWGGSVYGWKDYASLPL